MDLADWDEAGIWKDAKQCIGDMPRSFTGSLEDPVICEAGRRFLSQRLAHLSDKQIRDLFTVSQVTKRGEEIAGADGRRRPVGRRLGACVQAKAGGDTCRSLFCLIRCCK
ncbi:MAG TPA: hypothetical protein VNT81_22920 [Vicinamibacterales bacterium]|nr:hypothetical protein [Vicinamibacterales bacterium]